MGSGHEAIVESPEGSPYAGAAGKTRLVPIHLVRADGSAETRKVYRVVNVGTDPQLRDLAIRGDLHLLADGRRLLLPFVYHDPEDRKFALVIPVELSHLEFKEWATLMAEIAEDTSAAVPRYVREAATVVGFSALQQFTEAAEEPDDSELSDASEEESDGPEADARDADSALLAEREQQVAEQERGLSRMADTLTAREAEILRREEQLRTAMVDLELREQEMKERVAALLHEAQVVPPETPESEWQEVGSATVVGNEEATVVKSLESVQRDAELSRTSVPPPLHGGRAGGPPPLRPHGDGSAVGEDAAEVTDAEVSDASEAITDRPVSSAHVGPAREPDVKPPDGFHARNPGSLRERLVDEDLWIFAALDGPRFSRLGKAPELLLQAVEREGYPVVVLSLTGAREDGAVARRVLDGFSSEARALLSALENTFRARVALYVDGAYRESITLASLREGVARAANEMIDACLKGGDAKVDAKTALQDVTAKPPPLDTDDLPFGPARRPMSTTTTVFQAVEQLQSWLRPERQREALLIYSVPRHVIEASARRVLRAAMSYGVALSDEGAAAAIELGVVASRAQLLCNQLVAFRTRVQHGDNDLDDAATRRNWDALFKQAERHNVEVDQELRSFARPSQAPLPPAADSQTPRIFEARSTDELTAMLKKPNERAQAFRELCVRKHEPALPALFASLEAMAPLDAAAVAAHLLRFGDGLTDVVGRKLTTDNAHVRHASALLIGHLKQRRNLAPLVKQLDEESSQIWQEMARALGHFGSAGLRNLVRALPKAQHAERHMLAMGHLANHGCAQELESLENDESSEVSRAARQAMARRSRLQWEDLAVREQRSLAENSPAARFSQAFYAEAAKLDI